MIYQNSVTNAIYTILSNNTAVSDLGATVAVNDLFNQDPNLTPWIGIYSAPVTVEPRTVQRPNPWNIKFSPVLYLQNENRSYDGRQTMDGLEEILNTVMTAIDTHSNIDRTLMGTVDIVKSYDINTYQLNIDESNVIFSYELVINAERQRNL